MTQDKRTFPLWLSLSVLLNILLIGLIAGYLIGQPRGGPGPGGRPDAAALRSEVALGRGILRLTPEAERRALGQSFRQAMGQSGGQVRDRLRARNDLMTALRAETFDPGAVDAALETLQSADMRLQDALHEQLVRALSDLSPEQRAELADLMEEEGRRFSRSPQRLRDGGVPPPPR